MSLPENWHFNFGRNLHLSFKKFEQENLPDLASDLPGSGVLGVHGRYDDEVAILRWEVKGPGFILAFGTLDEQIFFDIKRLAGAERKFENLRSIEGLSGYYTHEQLIMIADIADGDADFEQMALQAEEWYNSTCVTRAENLNISRVNRVIPKPPYWKIDEISKGCWVIESAIGCSQGTAFVLEDVGWVTCAHVVSAGNGKIYADLDFFQPGQPNARYSPNLIAINEALDIAIFEAPLEVAKLRQADTSELKMHEHIAVCGYPNFTNGSGCVVSPGMVIAHKMRSGVQRMVTNAGIVAGMSGGPGVNSNSEVVGICANGAEYRAELRNTDDQSIIPIDALRILLS